jgi:hypothetical protein
MALIAKHGVYYYCSLIDLSMVLLCCIYYLTFNPTRKNFVLVDKITQIDE